MMSMYHINTNMPSYLYSMVKKVSSMYETVERLTGGIRRSIEKQPTDMMMVKQLTSVREEDTRAIDEIASSNRNSESEEES